MITRNPQHRAVFLTVALSLIGISLGLGIGFLAGMMPLIPGLLLGAIATLIFFFTHFELAVLALLILRSSLDVFSAWQVPAAFAIGLDALTLLYVAFQLIMHRPIQTDKFWWFLISWVVLQGLWVILLPLGGLGMDGAHLPTAIREWVRLFTWSMGYLLVMQLRDRLPPQKIVSTLFFALIIPVSVGLLQAFVPSVLPPLLIPSSIPGAGALISGETSRISGTVGLANTFATFLLLFISLTWWKVEQSKQRGFWVLLLAVLAFLLVGTKTLFSLMVLVVFILVLLAPRLNPLSFIGGILLLVLVVGLFGSTEYGQQRLGSIASTPLLNPDIDISRAILMSKWDGNSFNWRLAYWTSLLTAWQSYPVLGYGLGLSIVVGGGIFLPHNDYVRAIVDGGVVGFITFLILLIAQSLRLFVLWRAAVPGSAQQGLCFTLFALSLAIPVGMITENVWSHTTFFLYWWVLLAVAGWDWNQVEQGVSE